MWSMFYSNFPGKGFQYEIFLIVELLYLAEFNDSLPVTLFKIWRKKDDVCQAWYFVGVDGVDGVDDAKYHA